MAKKSKTITIPESWSEVSYKDYYRFIQAIEGQEEDEQLVTEMCLQYICNLHTEDYYKLSKATFKQVTDGINTLLTTKQPLVTAFEVFGKEYRFDPDLEKMSYGQYLDLTTYGKDLWKNMPIICSILYRPVKTKLGSMYELEPYSGTKDDTVQMFKELLTMDVCHGVVDFFLDLQTGLLKASLTSTMRSMKRSLTIQQQETLTKNGQDTQRLLHSVKETLQNLIK